MLGIVGGVNNMPFIVWEWLKILYEGITDEIDSSVRHSHESTFWGVVRGLCYIILWLIIAGIIVSLGYWIYSEYKVGIVIAGIVILIQVAYEVHKRRD
ncbi:MAG: hypothetical protein ABID64_01045 [Nitrospirota bacterium]